MSLPLPYTLLASPLLRLARIVARRFVPKLNQRVSTAEAMLQAVPRRITERARILFHAASMGELEQCVPVMRALRTADPSIEIIISCSSPSGIRHAHTLPFSTAVIYHPFESRNEIDSSLTAVMPDVVVINRYDVWPLFIDELWRRSIPAVLINATFPSAANNAVLRSTLAATYSRLHSITAVTAEDAASISKLSGQSVHVLPDSRTDRVLERVADAERTFRHLMKTTPTLVIGSSWNEDLELILPAVMELPEGSLRVVVVPHEPTESTLEAVERRISCTRLSNATENTEGHLLVDSVGVLLSLYALGSAAFVGGGFGAGVHSVLEPAGYGIPLACGPHITRSRDAVALQHAGACTIITSIDDVRRWLHEVVLNPDSAALAGGIARRYVAEQSGSSTAYAQMIREVITVQRSDVRKQ